MQGTNKKAVSGNELTFLWLSFMTPTLSWLGILQWKQTRITRKASSAHFIKTSDAAFLSPLAETLTADALHAPGESSLKGPLALDTMRWDKRVANEESLSLALSLMCHRGVLA